ncbi:hypothetical protein [Tumebacillus lipolyticus]|uniref:Helix-turn-helix domain-containing protein n=1 Tax=Tumebacillus lipolyticus TaxID=1280370 RepID=A0ABW4ZRC8_9BACL
MTVTEVLAILAQHGITDSEQTVRRWLRSGELKGTITKRKSGYEITDADLTAFIHSKRPDLALLAEIERLNALVAQLEAENCELRSKLSPVANAEQHSPDIVEMVMDLQLPPAVGRIDLPCDWPKVTPDLQPDMRDIVLLGSKHARRPHLASNITNELMKKGDHTRITDTDRAFLHHFGFAWPHASGRGMKYKDYIAAVFDCTE